METLSLDTVVIGGGVVGLAVARALALRGQEVVLVERHGHVGEETSSRNSEVIHGGLYYQPGSLKARLCVAGRDRLYDYCRARSIGFRQCGKWVVASRAEQQERLEALQANAAENGVALAPVPDAELNSVPGLRAVAALTSPLTGIIDTHAYMLALVGDVEAAGGWLALRTPVERILTDEQGHLLWLGGESPCRVRCRRVVNAAGLGAVALASRWEGMPSAPVPRQYLAKGQYFMYSGRHPFDRLIYPLPDEGGLGVHLTLDLAGQARFGPDVVWVEDEDLSVSEQRRPVFAEAIRQWWPEVDESRLSPGYAGLRPKLSGPGEAAADFVIQDSGVHGLEGVVHLFGIESPGLTASLAIADEVCARLLGSDSGVV